MGEVNRGMWRVDLLSGRGRGVVASRCIGAGEVVLVDHPALSVVCEEANEDFCSYCLRSLVMGHGEGSQVPSAIPVDGGEKGRRCQSCLSCSFCSEKCQQRACGEHIHSPSVCRALASLRGVDNLNSEEKSSARFLIAAYNLLSDGAAKVDVDDPMKGSPSTSHCRNRIFEKILALDGGDDRVTKEVEKLHAAVLESITSWFVSEDGGTYEFLKEKEGVKTTARLVARDQRNSFGIMAPFFPGGERKLRGYAMYLDASRLNHSCYPNVCRFDSPDSEEEGNLVMSFRALRDIAEGEEILGSYFPLGWNLRERQQRVKEEYGFVCDCARCVLESRWQEEAAGSGNVSDCEEGEEAEQEEEGGSDDCTWGQEEAEDVDEERLEHSVFLLQFVCPKSFCGGTLAPLVGHGSSPSKTMECNMCGDFRTNEELMQEIAGN